MNYATIKPRDVANGPGVRVSLFVSGCTHHCLGCFNAEAWDFDYGQHFDDSAEKRIIEALAPSYVRGFSLLGGEPFEPSNQAVLAPLLERIKKQYPDKTVWCYSGYCFEKDICAYRLGERAVTEKMLRHVDVLVDGRFVQEKKDLSLRFRGSSNQRIIDVPASLAAGRTVLWDEKQEI